MQDNAYIQRITNARQAYFSKDYKKCVQEAQLGLPHASTSEKAAPIHELLAAAYTRLNDPAAASAHQKWLADYHAKK